MGMSVVTFLPFGRERHTARVERHSGTRWFTFLLPEQLPGPGRRGQPGWGTPPRGSIPPVLTANTLLVFPCLAQAEASAQEQGHAEKPGAALPAGGKEGRKEPGLTGLILLSSLQPHRDPTGETRKKPQPLSKWPLSRYSQNSPSLGPQLSPPHTHPAPEEPRGAERPSTVRSCCDKASHRGGTEDSSVTLRHTCPRTAVTFFPSVFE